LCESSKRNEGDEDDAEKEVSYGHGSRNHSCRTN
jgi:hypothetical protein